MHWTARHVKQITYFFWIYHKFHIYLQGLKTAELKVVLINTEFGPDLLAPSVLGKRQILKTNVTGL